MRMKRHDFAHSLRRVFERYHQHAPQAFPLTSLAIGQWRKGRRNASQAERWEELQAAVRDHSPPLHKSRPVKLYFATQASASPPLIVISANRGRCLVPAWERYFIRRLRKRWGLFGVPVRLVVRGRGRGNAERRGGR